MRAKGERDVHHIVLEEGVRVRELHHGARRNLGLGRQVLCEGVAVSGPPQNLEAERAVLGSVLLDPNMLPAVRAALSEEDFYAPDHREVFGVLVGMAEAATGIDAVTLADALRAAGVLERVGGAEFIVSLMETVPSAANAVAYADVVRRCGARREGVKLARELGEAAGNEAEDLPEVLRETRTQLDALEVRYEGKPRWDAEAVSVEVIAALDAEERQRRAWGTGLPRLDALTGGLEEASVVVIGGRSQHVKTGLAAGLLVPATLRAGRGALYASYEENTRAVWRRVVGPLAKVSPSAARKGECGATDREVFTEWSRWLAGEPFAILESPSLAELESEVADRLPGLVVLDSLQAQAHTVPPRKGTDAMRLHLGYLMAVARTLAGRYGACVVVVSHVSSESAKRREMPHRRDLAESRTIEQQADTILMVWWPRVDFPERKANPLYGHRYLVQVQKNRIGGPNGTLAFGIVPHTQELTPLDEYEEEQALREYQAERG